MKKLSAWEFAGLLICFAGMMLFAGCTTTTITTYDKEGNIVTIEEATSDIVDKVTKSTTDKSVFIWKSGWMAYMSVSMMTEDDPTPTFRVFAGKMDRGYASIHKNHMKLNFVCLAKVLEAMSSKNLSVTTSGVSESEK